MLDLPNWLFVIPILGSLVLVHEFGHFITAKIFNIKVTEFGFGFPPKIWGYKKGETTYTINLIPIGGFVKMVGEEDSTDPRSFAAQSIMKRLIVLAAGPVMNLLTAIVIFIVLLMIPHETYVGNIVVTNIAPNSPAMNSNLQVGDNIIAINNNRISTTAELIEEVKKNRDTETELSVQKNLIMGNVTASPEFSHTTTIILTPRSNPPKLKVVDIVSDSTKEVSYTDAQTYDQNLKIGDTMTQGSLGVIIGLSNPKIIEEQLPIWKAIPESFGQLSNILTLTFSGLANWSQSGEDPGFTGPIGIAQITGEVAKIGYNPLFELTALISISLGILNLLPIPALDGGRITFILIEAARGGKRISAKIEGIIHMTGFAVLISLIILMSYFDLARILTGGNIIN
jgi:regulator of sigma E protease